MSAWWRSVVAALIMAVSAQLGSQEYACAASGLDRYLDLPLINRNATWGPGGVNPILPYDRNTLLTLLNQARRRGIPPSRYRALLFQYWLVDTTDKAGIDLRSWNPWTGAWVNRENLVKSYTYYEKLQLTHRELQWAGMGGQVGADFGGGLLDFELISDVYSLPGIADASRAVVTAATNIAGPQVIDRLPRGLVALARAGTTMTPDDLHWIIGMIMVMQKNIFSDLMPMHDAYVTRGLPALAEFRDAGLFGNDIYDAWRDIASRNPDRIALGNAGLLRREQQWAVGKQWDQVRTYHGDVGEAITYLSTVAGSPSVAGVIPPRAFDPVRIPITDAMGRPALLQLPLPNWNWSVFPQRWRYINMQLLPKYKYEVNHNWPALAATLSIPYDEQLEAHRPLLNIPQFLLSAAQETAIIPLGSAAETAR